jgi:hypothetical protein
MDATRFYFADGAAQRHLVAHLEGNGAKMEDVFQLANAVNLALAALIGRFIEQRDSASLAKA